MFKKWWFMVPLLAFIALVAGCSGDKQVTDPPVVSDESIGPVAQAVGPAWESYIVSEAYYALCQQRTGTSHLVYNGLAMSDWDYPHSDGAALTRLIQLYGSDTGPLGLWNTHYRQGGWCKFFVDMVLYRSSYGYPGGHLFLKTGYSWAPSYIPYNAQPGWILQKPGTSPHTAIVVARYSHGLDVVDSNFIGTAWRDGHWVYSYAIGRHLLTWEQLNSYKAYRAHEVCQLVN